MTKKLELIQFLYEISMTIGNSRDLKKMLRLSISTILRKLGCSSGGVHLLQQGDDNTFLFEQVFSIPRDTSTIKEYQAALSSLPKSLRGKELCQLQSSLPLAAPVSDNSSYTIVELQNIGVLILVKRGPQLDPLVLNALEPIFSKLADACISCLQNDELSRHRRDLEQLVEEKAQEIIKKNHQLTKEVEAKTRIETEREKLITKLQEALANVKTLSKMLPICSSCKSIRDDQGYWNEITEYIEKHSATMFSHSLCPSCSRELYGGEDWFEDMQDNT